MKDTTIQDKLEAEKNISFTELDETVLISIFLKWLLMVFSIIRILMRMKNGDIIWKWPLLHTQSAFWVKLIWSGLRSRRKLQNFYPVSNIVPNSWFIQIVKLCTVEIESRRYTKNWQRA